MANVWNIDSQFPKNHQAIVPSDDDDATGNLECEMTIIANEEGTIAVVDRHDTVYVYNVTPGYVIPVQAKRVNATDTTADCVGVF